MNTDILVALNTKALLHKDMGLFVPFDANDKATFSPKYGKYYIYTSKNIIYKEVWNNTGWATPGITVLFWASILTKPKK